MQNTIKSNRVVSEEELNKIKEMDWDSYYREAAPPEAQGLTTCSDCGAIIMVREDLPATTCYKCGAKLAG